MKHQPHFDTAEAAQREAAKIRKMIGDLDRSVKLLNCDVASEEERTRISDRSDAAYSILARMLAIRCNNLRNTIAALERRLTSLDQAERVAELA
jgi:multidrug resistance efflux pump